MIMRIRAAEHLAEDGDIVKSAENLSFVVRRGWQPAGPRMSIVFVGLPSSSSSYFNLFLRRVCDLPGAREWIGDDRNFEFGSSVQRSLFEVSRRAVEQDVSESGDAER
jgi:hypothetical protein